MDKRDGMIWKAGTLELDILMYQGNQVIRQLRNQPCAYLQIKLFFFSNFVSGVLGR